MYEDKTRATFGKSDHTHQFKGCQIKQQNGKTAKSDSSKRTSQMKAVQPVAVIQRASMDPQSLTAAEVMQLQSTIGNSAVAQMFRKKGEVCQMRKRETKDENYKLTDAEERMCEQTGRELSAQKHNHAGTGVHVKKYSAGKHDERNNERDAQSAIQNLKEQVLQRKETGKKAPP